jgi:hypothetical protein
MASHDRSRLQIELINILSLEGRTHPYFLRTTTTENLLFSVSLDGPLTEMESLLRDSTNLSAALAYKTRPAPVTGEMEQCNLCLMLLLAVKGFQASIVGFLLSIGQKHGIDSIFPEALISRDLVSYSLKDFACFRELQKVQPYLVNEGLGHMGHPLIHVIGSSEPGHWAHRSVNEEIVFVKFLLENGADPNEEGNWQGRPGRQLITACKIAPLGVVELLLVYGAQVKQSGAIQAAVSADRVDVLELLKQYGADVDEFPKFAWEDIYDRQAEQSQKQETPLHIAIRKNAKKALKWLLENGADTELIGQEWQDGE